MIPAVPSPNYTWGVSKFRAMRGHLVPVGLSASLCGVLCPVPPDEYATRWGAPCPDCLKRLRERGTT